MKYDRFIEQVHTRAHVTTADAIGATRATLNTVAERLGAEEARHLATQLPREIGRYLLDRPDFRAEHFSFGEFCQRVAIRENSNVPDAISHARCVIETLEQAARTEKSRSVLAMLHEEFAPLFYDEPTENPGHSTRVPHTSGSGNSTFGSRVAATMVPPCKDRGSAKVDVITRVY